MAGGLKSVGVPLPEAGGDSAKVVELWPLIQAYALQDFEDVTGGGFFTQRHRCVPCGPSFRRARGSLRFPPSSRAS